MLIICHHLEFVRRMWYNIGNIARKSAEIKWKVSILELTSLSKYLSLLLRHKPEIAGITLDRHGWADVDELIAGVAKSRAFDMQTLEAIVASDTKKRYEFNADKSKIRACQGHSVKVDTEPEQLDPPELLYHGSCTRFTESIQRSGLLPGQRLYVHLTVDYLTARKVGSRRGKPVVYIVRAAKMAADGYKFYRSSNGVWLAKAIPSEYLELMPENNAKGAD